MRIRNTSSRPTAEVRDLVRWACEPIDMRRVCVNVKNCSGAFAGNAYDSVPTISNAPNSCDRLVTLRIGADSSFPVKDNRYPGSKSDSFPVYDINDWREGLVFLAAHEAAHIEQFKEGKRRSEIRCEKFAVKRLGEFRALQQDQQGSIDRAPDNQ